MKLSQFLRRYKDPNYRSAVLHDLDRILQHVEDQSQFGFASNIRQDAWMNRMEGLSWPFIRSVRFNAGFVLSALYCAFTDHLWEDDSYGGPESGCMAGHCTRCGYSFHTQLY